MATLFTLTTPANVGTLIDPRVISSLAITEIFFSSTPQTALTGTGELELTLTDPDTGWQERILYKDESVPAFFSTVAPPPPNGATVEDIMCGLLFAKLIADGKLPAGTVEDIPAQVTAVITAPTSTVITGESLALTAVISSPFRAAPTCEVTFLDGNVVLGTAMPTRGLATLTATALAAGEHTLTAAVAASAGFTAAVSVPIVVTVADAAPLS